MEQELFSHELTVWSAAALVPFNSEDILDTTTVSSVKGMLDPPVLVIHTVWF